MMATAISTRRIDAAAYRHAATMVTRSETRMDSTDFPHALEPAADAWLAREMERLARVRAAEIDRDSMLEALTLASSAISELLLTAAPRIVDQLRQAREYIEAAWDAAGG